MIASLHLQWISADLIVSELNVLLVKMEVREGYEHVKIEEEPSVVSYNFQHFEIWGRGIGNLGVS